MINFFFNEGMSPNQKGTIFSQKDTFPILPFSIQTHRIHVCIFTYIWLMFMVNVGKYTIHGSYGKHYPFAPCTEIFADIYDEFKPNVGK